MRDPIIPLLAATLLCGCGGEDRAVEEPVAADAELPELALTYMDDLCTGGDEESCQVLETLDSTRALCESGDEKGCASLDEIVEALEGLNQVLLEERCMDPCSEKCLQECVSVPEEETGPCLDRCVGECLVQGCD